MSATSDFYLTQAEKCSTDAAGAVLEQVRDRNLRAAAAWRVMAEKLIHTENLRAKQAALKESAAAASE